MHKTSRVRLLHRYAFEEETCHMTGIVVVNNALRAESCSLQYEANWELVNFEIISCV